MPFLSIVRSAALVSRRFTHRFSVSTQKRRRCRFGRNRRLVLLLAWDTWCPTIGPLPVTWQTRAIARSNSLKCRKSSIVTGNAKRFKHLGALQQSALGKRHRPRAGDDEMVERPDLDQRQRLLQGLGEQLVGAARFGDA